MAEGDDNRNKRLCPWIFTFFIIIIPFIIIGVFVTPWFVGPRFTVVDGAMYGLNPTSPLFSSITTNFTILIKNPSKKLSFHYDGLTADVWYMNTKITTSSMLAPLTVERLSSAVMSLVLGGEEAMPVSFEVADHELGKDGGAITVSVVLHGTVEWRLYKLIKSDVDVICDVQLGMERGLVGELHLLRTWPCRVHI